MAIPDSIKSVKRPSNTRLKNINGKYIVILRISVRDGKRAIPIELGTIGEIVNDEYVAYPNPNIRNASEARLAYKERNNSNNQTESIVTNGETPQATNAGRKKKETIYTVKVSGPVELIDNMGKGLMQELTNIFGIV